MNNHGCASLSANSCGIGLKQHNRADDHDEIFGFQRDQKSEKDRPIRKHDSVRHQYAVNCSGRAYNCDVLKPEEVSRNYGDNGGADPANEIEAQELGGSPETFDLCTEHPKTEHVPQDVAKVVHGMEEHIGNELPNGKRLNHLGGHERKVLEEHARGAGLQDVSKDENANVCN